MSADSIEILSNSPEIVIFLIVLILGIGLLHGFIVMPYIERKAKEKKINEGTYNEEKEDIPERPTKKDYISLLIYTLPGIFIFVILSIFINLLFFILAILPIICFIYFLNRMIKDYY